VCVLGIHPRSSSTRVCALSTAAACTAGLSNSSLAPDTILQVLTLLCSRKHVKAQLFNTRVCMLQCLFVFIIKKMYFQKDAAWCCPAVLGLTSCYLMSHSAASCGAAGTRPNAVPTARTQLCVRGCAHTDVHTRAHTRTRTHTHTDVQELHRGRALAALSPLCACIL
jgi:hypothetical protein